MTVLRDKIADVFECHEGEWTCYVLADSIIAALPSMVVPLVWEKRTSGSSEFPAWKSGMYLIVESLNMGGFILMGVTHGTLDEAKAAANAHHAAAAVAAFTGLRQCKGNAPRTTQ